MCECGCVCVCVFEFFLKVCVEIQYAFLVMYVCCVYNKTVYKHTCSHKNTHTYIQTRDMYIDINTRIHTHTQMQTYTQLSDSEMYCYCVCMLPIFMCVLWVLCL